MTNKEFENCKVGDKVICNIDCEIGFLPKEGNIGTIWHKDNEIIKIEWGRKDLSVNWNWFYNYKHHEFYESIKSLDLIKEKLKIDFYEDENE
jgi:hypothetical protein